MLILKYQKTGDATFISHIDTLRYLTRAMRRTGYDVEYSKGFNPHMMLNLSAPLAMGVASLAEYVTIGINDIAPQEFLAKYNSVTTPNLRGVKCWAVDKNPNIAALATASVYDYPVSDVLTMSQVVQRINAAPVYEITYTQKGKEVTKDVKDMIHSLTIGTDKIRMILASGNTNLRADRLLTAICADAHQEFRLSAILRTMQLTSFSGKFLNVDSYLNSCATAVSEFK